MKALVIDDDPTAQKIMKLLLEKSGYAPVVVSDGQKGIETALGPEAPPLVILDWVLPDVDGLAVCKKLREANPKVRPYIIFLTAKKEKNDAANGLDGGADDFISKPFNVVELQARLRVARRTIEYQHELQKRAEEKPPAPALTMRHFANVPMPAGEAGAGRTGNAAMAAAVDGAPVRVQKRPEEFSNQEIRFMLSAALMEMRLVLEAAKPRNGAEPLGLKSCDYCAWGGLLMRDERRWMDVIVAVKETTMTSLFGKALNRKASSEVEYRYFLAEIARRIAMGFMRTLEKRGGAVLHPLMSRTVKVDTHNMIPALPPDAKSYDLVIDGEDVQLLVSIGACPMREATPGSLRELDVLAEQFPSKEFSEVPMFTEGTVLTPRFIEKLVFHIETSQVEELVKVCRPSGMAQYFNYTE